MSKQKIEQFYFQTEQLWRTWLAKNHQCKDAVWLVFYKKHTGKPSIKWSDAVDQALCYGWIDSKVETLDKDSFRQYYCKRKPNSTWSKINKQKIEILIAEGLMTKAGMDVIDVAKLNGAWNLLDEVEELKVPWDLENAFTSAENAKNYFLSMSKSKQKLLLQWITLAKTETTRQRRIVEVIENAAQKQLPKAFRPKDSIA